MRAGKMLVTHPDGREQAIAMGAGMLRIGSAPNNDLVIAGSGIAPHHARIYCDERGDLIMAVGGVEIELPRAFAAAALLRVGGYLLRYQAPDVAQRYGAYNMPWSQPEDSPANDSGELLSALLLPRIVWVDETASAPDDDHEASTIEMPVLNQVIQDI